MGLEPSICWKRSDSTGVVGDMVMGETITLSGPGSNSNHDGYNLNIFHSFCRNPENISLEAFAYMEVLDFFLKKILLCQFHPALVKYAKTFCGSNHGYLLNNVHVTHP